MPLTFIGCKVTKFPSNNSHVIHKKVHFDNLFLALFVILVLFHPAFLWYFVFVMQCIVRVRIIMSNLTKQDFQICYL